jgi:hypothetical protein
VSIGKSKDQLKEEIEPFAVPPVLLSGFSGVPTAGADISESEIKDKFKEAFNALPEDQKAAAKDYAKKFLAKDWAKFVDPAAEVKAAVDKDEWPWQEAGDLPKAYL